MSDRFTRPAAEPVTYYAHTVAYRRPGDNQAKATIGISPVLGVDPLSDEEVEALALRYDREGWDEGEWGPYSDYHCVSFGVARMIRRPGDPIGEYA
jgi:hypothetical protein